MKQVDFYEQSGKPKAWKRFGVPLFIALPVIGILIAVPLGLHFWDRGGGLDAAYRYRFARPSPGSVTSHLEKEIGFYQERISHDPDGGLNRASLARTYLKMARATGESSWYLLAEQTAQQSLANLPVGNNAAILVLARVAEARHDFAEALRLAKQTSGHEDALAIAVTSNLALGKVDLANQAAEALVGNFPTVGSLALRALVKVARGKNLEAIKDFQQAMAVEEPEETGSSVWVRTLLGRTYYKQGELQQAEALYREALRILPQYSPALLNLAELEIRRGDYQAAQNIYSQFFLTSQRSPTVYDHVVMRGMARALELQGDSSGAREWRDKAEARLRQDLTGFGHRRELARLLLDRGSSKDVAEALSLMQKEVGFRRDAETLSTLAWALSASGRWREAQQAMQEALRWGIRDAGMFYRAGTIEQKLGNQDRASSFFRQAQETDPTFDEQARRALGLGL